MLMNKAETAEGYPLVFSSKRDKQARDWSITGANLGNIGEDNKYHLNVVNSGQNLFNALSERTRKYFTGNTSYANTEKRPFTGSGYYVGLSSTNYYISSNISSHSIINDNEISVTNAASSSAIGYGIAFDFAVKPGEVYAVSYKTTSTGTTRPVTYCCYGQDGTIIYKDGYINQSTNSITIRDNCYWLVLIFGAINGATQTYSDIQLELTSKNTFKPYRKPTNTEVTLDEQINGTVTYKSGTLPPLQVCEGTNIVVVEAETQPTNMNIKY